MKKLKFKPWISSSLQNSILIKNSIFMKYINKKDPHIKEELHQKSNLRYRNIIAIIIKKNKQNYFTKYFESNIKSDSLLPKKYFICFNESHLKMMKNAFCFILKVVFVLKVFRSLF